MPENPNSKRGIGADDSVAFPTLSTQEIDILRKYGVETILKDREPLWRPGESDYCVSIILSGGCFVRDSVDSESLIAYHSPGAFTGDVDVMTGRPAPVGGFADGETHILQLSASDVRLVVRVEQDLGGKILIAFIRRRELLLESAAHGLLVIGSGYDPDTQSIREFLGRNRVVHRWRQPEDPETAEIMKAFDLTVEDTPLVLSFAA